MSGAHVGDIVILLNNVVGIFIAIRFLNYLLEKKSNKPINFKLSLCGVIVIATVINIALETLGINLLIGFILYFLIGLIYYKGKVHVKLIASIFLLVFSLVTELVTAIIIGAVLGDQIQNARENLMFLFLGTVVSKILMMLVIEFIIRFKRRKASQVSLSSWMFIISIPIISIVLAISSVYEPVVSGTVSGNAILSCVAILYIDLIAFYLFDNIVVQVDENNQYKFREQQLLYQKDQYENVIAGYNQIKRVRHDMIGHFITVKGYLVGNKTHEAVEYLGKLSDELNIETKGILSRNVAVDAIINNRKTKANALGIQFDHEIMIPEQLHIDDMDICIIIGNALNNAIEACERITDINCMQLIRMRMKYKKGSVLLDIKNTYNPDTIKSKNKKYISSKIGRAKGAIGTGMGNIMQTVEKYGGICQSDCNNEYFKLQIVIPDKSAL